MSRPATAVGGRPSRAWVAAAILVAGSGAIVTLAVGQGLTFFLDELDFTDVRRLDLASLLRPHNEHWSAGLVVVYRLLVETFGTDSYLPFQVALVATSAALGLCLYVLVATHAGPGRGLVVVALAGVLGAGYENLVWAFQVGWLLAALFGFAALHVALNRPVVAAVLLLASVATAGIGLAFVAAVGAMLIAGRPRGVPWLALPVGVFVVWWLVWGRFGGDDVPPPDVVAMPLIVVRGIAGGVGGSMGMDEVPGLVIAAAWVAWVASRRGRPITPIVWGALAGLLALFVAIAVVRSGLGSAQATAPRYVHVAALFAMVIGSLTLPPATGRWRLVAAAWIGYALAANYVLLVGGAADWRALQEAHQAGVPATLAGAGHRYAHSDERVASHPPGGALAAAARHDRDALVQPGSVHRGDDRVRPLAGLPEHRVHRPRRCELGRHARCPPPLRRSPQVALGA